MRRKMTEEEKLLAAKKKTEKQVAEQLVFELERLRERIFYGEPTIIYKVGERVIRGAIKESTVVEVLDGGKIYKLHEICTENNYGKPYDYERYSYVTWVDIHPYVTLEENSRLIPFKAEDEIRLNVQSRQIEGLLHSYWNYGIDTETDYQRGNVWSPEQELMLINSIFENVQIGSFVFVRREYKEGEKGYEVVDGKQRLLTLVKFAESRFPFRGRLYRDLRFSDRNHFDDYMVGYSEIRNITQAQKYKLFLKLNTCGQPQEPSHLNRVRKLLEITK